MYNTEHRDICMLIISKHSQYQIHEHFNGHKRLWICEFNMSGQIKPSVIYCQKTNSIYMHMYKLYFIKRSKAKNGQFVYDRSKKKISYK